MHQVFPPKESNRWTNEYLNIYIYIQSINLLKTEGKEIEEMANKSTTIPIKLAVNCARLESIRKITQSYRVSPFLQSSTRSIAYERRWIDPSLWTPVDSTYIRLLALEKNDSLDLLRFCGRRRERKHKRNEEEVSKNYDEMWRVNFWWDLAIRIRKETV